MHGKVKNNFIVLIAFAQRFIFPNPLLMTLICGPIGRFNFHFIIKAAIYECSAVLCIACTRETFNSDQCQNTNKWAGNMLMFHVDVNIKQLGISVKNDSFQWFRVDSFI